MLTEAESMRIVLIVSKDGTDQRTQSNRYEDASASRLSGYSDL